MFAILDVNNLHGNWQEIFISERCFSYEAQRRPNKVCSALVAVDWIEVLEKTEGKESE